MTEVIILILAIVFMAVYLFCHSAAISQENYSDRCVTHRRRKCPCGDYGIHESGRTDGWDY